MTGFRLVVSLAAIAAFLFPRTGGFAASCFPLLASAPAAAGINQDAPRPGVQVLFSFHNADLQEALLEFGRLLDLGSVRADPNVKGTLTVESPSPVSRERNGDSHHFSRFRVRSWEVGDGEKIRKNGDCPYFTSC